MHDITNMTLRDMSECGLALRRLGDGALNMEEVSNKIIQYLYDNFVDSSSEKACVLIRFFKTHSYGELTPDLQQYASELLSDKTVPDNLKCLTLLASAGELLEWNSRHQSVGHKAIPLANEDAIARIPMISQLIQQLGISPGVIVKPDPEILIDLEQKVYNIFYVPNALNSPYIPSQKSFVVPFNIKSVLGFGGLLPSGNMFAVLMFLKVFIPANVIELFRPLALNIKMAVLPFDGNCVFKEHISRFNDLENNPAVIDENQQKLYYSLNSQIATLNQLLDVSEQSTITQSDRLEEAISNLHQALNKLKNTQVQLIQNEKMSSLGQMIAGIAHEINNPITFIHTNVSYAEEYIQILLDLVSLYQEKYPQPTTEIQQKIENIEFDFVVLDLNNVIKSMKIGTQRIAQIILSLRNFSRLDESEIKEADIHSGIDSALLILQHRLKAHDKNNSEIKVVKIYDDLPLLECYPAQINQVLMNIITNAIDAIKSENYIESHSKEPQITISTKLVDQDWITVTITDNGIGMSEEVISKLFDPFFTTKPVGQGTGLGLSISYQIIVEKHKGKIICQSQLGKGTEFIIKIPVKMQV